MSTENRQQTTEVINKPDAPHPNRSIIIFMQERWISSDYHKDEGMKFFTNIKASGLSVTYAIDVEAILIDLKNARAGRVEEVLEYLKAFEEFTGKAAIKNASELNEKLLSPDCTEFVFFPFGDANECGLRREIFLKATVPVLVFTQYPGYEKHDPVQNLTRERSNVHIVFCSPFDAGVPDILKAFIEPKRQKNFPTYFSRTDLSDLALK